jgi:hypothetical protein
MLPTGRFYRDFNVLAERGEEVHEALHREGSRLSTHQCRDVGLLNAQYLAGPGLGKAAVLNQPVNSQGELGFDLLSFGVGKAKVSTDVATPPFDEDSLLLFRLSSAFLDDPVPR